MKKIFPLTIHDVIERFEFNISSYYNMIYMKNLFLKLASRFENTLFIDLSNPLLEQELAGLFETTDNKIFYHQFIDGFKCMAESYILRSVPSQVRANNFLRELIRNA